MNNYHINLFYSTEDGGYIADIPDLKNCSAFGESPEEALSQVLVAQKLWLDEANASNMEIPPALYKPLIYQIAN